MRRHGGIFVGAAEAQQILGIGPRVFRRWRAKGIIPFYRDEDTGILHYSRSQLEEIGTSLRTGDAAQTAPPLSRRLRRSPHPDVTDPLELPREAAS